MEESFDGAGRRQDCRRRGLRELCGSQVAYIGEIEASKVSPSMSVLFRIVRGSHTCFSAIVRRRDVEGVLGD